MSKMFIAQIVLPKTGNDGECINHAHAFIKQSLCHKFGGFTGLDSFGGWIDPKTGVEYLEAGITYQTGMEDTPENADIVRKIAIRAGVMASQLAMAVTLPNGEFEILQTGTTEGVANA
jgi:hypothetical protein